MKTVLSLTLYFHCISLFSQSDDSPVIEFPDTIFYKYPEITISKGAITIPVNAEIKDTINEPFGVIYLENGQCFLSIQKGKNNYTISITDAGFIYDGVPEISTSRIVLNKHKREELIIELVQDFWHAGSCGGNGYTNKTIFVWDLHEINQIFWLDYFYESNSFTNTGCYPPEDSDSTTVFEGEWVQDYLEEEKYQIQFRSETITITPERTSANDKSFEYHNYAGTETVIYRPGKKYMLRIK